MKKPTALEITWSPDEDVLSISFDTGEVTDRVFDPEVRVPNGCEAFVHASFNAVSEFVEIEFVNASLILPQSFLQRVKMNKVDCVVNIE